MNIRKSVVCLLALAAALSARTLHVGEGQEYASPAQLPQLLPGDVVEIHSGVYKQALRYFGAGTAEQPIIIRGVGPTKPIFDGRGQSMDSPRAFFEMYGPVAGSTYQGGYWIIENIECRYAQNRADAMNASCVRNVNSNVTIRNMKAWNNAGGVMSSDQSGETIIEDSDIGFNGYGDGHSHNLYLHGRRAVVRRSKVHDSTVGQNVKARSRFVELSYNHIFDSQDGEIGIIQPDPIDSQPNQNAAVFGNVITTRAIRGAGNCCSVVVFGRDMGTVSRNGMLYLVGNTIWARAANQVHVKMDGTQAGLDARYNSFLGSKLILDQRTATDKTVTGANNWTEAGARLPVTFTVPAVWPYADQLGAALEARPGVVSKGGFVAAPQNVTRVLGQGGFGLAWDAVPGASYYKILRQPVMNGIGQWKTTWGGSSETQYVDMFQHVASTATRTAEYRYWVIAVDADGSESAPSAMISMSR